MLITNYIEKMVKLQETMNISICGPKWEFGFTNDHSKEINWLRCINMELSELINSTSWKHWKSVKGETDWLNIKVELVDIWHFLISFGLESFNLNRTVLLIENVFSKITQCTKSEPLVIKNSENMQLEVLKIQKDIYSDKGELTGELYSKLLNSFLYIMVVSNLKFEDLYKIYIGKNALNKLRQDNGYKEDNYQKIWLINKCSVEDNVFMMSLLDKIELSDNLFEIIYLELEKEYKKIFKTNNEILKK